MGNLCLCCYVRREDWKSPFSLEERPAEESVNQGKTKAKKKLSPTEWLSADSVDKSKSPATVIPRTPSLTSSDVSSAILIQTPSNSNCDALLNGTSRPRKAKGILKSTSRVKYGHTMVKAISEPTLHDIPKIVVTDHKGFSTDTLPRRSSHVQDTAVDNTDSDSTSFSLTIPSTKDNTSTSIPNSLNRIPTSPALSNRSDGSAKSRSQSRNEIVNTLAVIEASSLILGSNRPHNKSDKKSVPYRSYSPTNSASRKEEKKSRHEKDKKADKKTKGFGQIRLKKSSAKKGR